MSELRNKGTRDRVRRDLDSLIPVVYIAIEPPFHVKSSSIDFDTKRFLTFRVEHLHWAFSPKWTERTAATSNYHNVRCDNNKERSFLCRHNPKKDKEKPVSHVEH